MDKDAHLKNLILFEGNYAFYKICLRKLGSTMAYCLDNALCIWHKFVSTVILNHFVVSLPKFDSTVHMLLIINKKIGHSSKFFFNTLRTSCAVKN